MQLGEKQRHAERVRETVIFMQTNFQLNVHSMSTIISLYQFTFYYQINNDKGNTPLHSYTHALTHRWIPFFSFSFPHTHTFPLLLLICNLALSPVDDGQAGNLQRRVCLLACIQVCALVADSEAEGDHALESVEIMYRECRLKK